MIPVQILPPALKPPECDRRPVTHFLCVSFHLLSGVNKTLSRVPCAHSRNASWNYVCVLVVQSYSTLCDPMDCSPPGCSIHGDSEYWSVLPCSPSGDFPNPGIEPRSPALQVDSLPSELPGKAKNTGVGSLSFSRGSSQPRDRTQVSCIAGGFFTI